MTSSFGRRFKRLFRRLPAHVQTRALEKLQLWEDNPAHPSLHFKKVSQSQPIWSIRIGGGYRVVGERDGEEVLWKWIGTHNDYDNLL